jgi:hypothetical protein
MNRNFKHKDRVLSNRKMGSIPTRSAGRFIEDMPFHVRTNPNGDRVAVRFDEYPHDYVVSRLGLDREPDPNAKPRDTKGRFV